MIVIVAHDIDISGTALAMELPASWLSELLADAELRAAEPGKLSARLSRSGKADIVVRGKVNATVLARCIRCLDDTPVTVEGELGLLLKPRAAPPRGRASRENGKPAKPGAATEVVKKKSRARHRAEDEYEFRADEAEEDTYDGERVLLDEFVREAILLELPTSPLCSEGCEGIEAPEVGSMRGALKTHSQIEAQAPAARPNPFEALRHLMSGDSAPAEGEDVARRPSPAEVRKVARKKSKQGPKLRSSLAKRTKK